MKRVDLNEPTGPNPLRIQITLTGPNADMMRKIAALHETDPGTDAKRLLIDALVGEYKRTG